MRLGLHWLNGQHLHRITHHRSNDRVWRGTRSLYQNSQRVGIFAELDEESESEEEIAENKKD